MTLGHPQGAWVCCSYTLYHTDILPQCVCVCVGGGDHSTVDRQILPFYNVVACLCMWGGVRGQGGWESKGPGKLWGGAEQSRVWSDVEHLHAIVLCLCILGGVCV